MTTATIRERITALEREKADYSGELTRTLARLDVLRREVRESGPGNTTAAQVRELEADETRLRGTLAQVEVDLEAVSVSLRNAENAERRNQNAQTMTAHRDQLARRGEAMLQVRAAYLVLQDALFQAHAVNVQAMLTGQQAREAARDTAILDGLPSDDLGLGMLTAVSGVLHGEKLTAEDCGYLPLPTLPAITWPLDKSAARADLLAALERVQ